MKIYITGCSGFLGKYISNKLSIKYNIKKINLREIHNFNQNNYDFFSVASIIFEAFVVSIYRTHRKNMYLSSES